MIEIKLQLGATLKKKNLKHTVSVFKLFLNRKDCGVATALDLVPSAESKAPKYSKIRLPNLTIFQ